MKEKILKLCPEDFIFKNYHSLAEVTFMSQEPYKSGGKVKDNFANLKTP